MNNKEGFAEEVALVVEVGFQYEEQKERRAFQP